MSQSEVPMEQAEVLMQPSASENDRPSSKPAWQNNDARLALELVANLRPRDEVAKAYGYSIQELKHKLKDPFFKSILREANKLWTSDSNTKERIRAKTAFLVEDALLDMFRLLKNPEVAPQAKNDTFKSLARIAAVDTPEKEISQSEGFRVVINMGNTSRELPVTKNLIEGD